MLMTCLNPIEYYLFLDWYQYLMVLLLIEYIYSKSLMLILTACNGCRTICYPGTNQQDWLMFYTFKRRIRRLLSFVHVLYPSNVMALSNVRCPVTGDLSRIVIQRWNGKYFFESTQQIPRTLRWVFHSAWGYSLSNDFTSPKHPQLYNILRPSDVYTAYISDMGLLPDT